MLALGSLFVGCKPPAKTVEKAVAAPPIRSELGTQFAMVSVDAAMAKLDSNQPGEALGLLVSALKTDPACEEARALAEKILSDTIWNFPEITLAHSMAIDQVNFTEPSSLWVSLLGEGNTTVRWDLDRLKIESVLFPVSGVPTRSLVFHPRHLSVVVERGPATLLCNAQSLKPIRDLGLLPDFLTPSAVIVFSPDGLLMAHPAFISEKDHSIVWHLRDTATGQIIRSSEAVAATSPQPLAALLDRSQLRVIHTDGSLLEIPVSPLESIRAIPFPESVKLQAAQFSSDGNSVLALQDQGPHLPPVQSIIAYHDETDSSLKIETLTRRFPWSLQPNIWNGLMRGPDLTPFSVDGKILKFLTTSQAPLETASPITAADFEEKRMITGEQNGTVTIHRLLPLPGKNNGERKNAPIDAESLTTLENLCEALTGKRHDAKQRAFTPIPTKDRFTALDACDFDRILAIFPNLDFSPVMAEFKATHVRDAAPEAFQPLLERLARSKMSPSELTQMEEFFRTSESPAILAAIQSSGGKGPVAAAALAVALKSDHPDWIAAALASAVDLPPLLRQLSVSRIAWLQGRKADALSGWSETFPELTEIRRCEDWDGWEQADFKPALENIRECVGGELAAIRIPESSTPEQRKAIATRLTDPATIAAVGRTRYAEACLKAALAFSAYKEDKETTFLLAKLARDLGAPPEPCLRAEALALTALGDYQNAHPRWIELITEHPVETTLPGDYAEAAYTAFENSDPRQAMEILTTGLHRFPQDANFALRAGWVALLTGNSERAYRFLREGERIGFPAEKLENATALLTIAAAQTGSTDDAAVYFQDLLKIDPAWADTTTLDTLNWPEELKDFLRQYMQ
jgi:tetratricopeptide (TPR) repeat protein